LVVIPTIISVLKIRIFKCVLLSTRKPHGRTIMNLFGELKLRLHLFKQYFTLPIPTLQQGKSKITLGPDTSQAHPSYAQFLSVNFSNCAAQNYISWPTTACKHQQVSHSWSKSHLNTNPLNQNVSKQRKKSYREVTEISASLAFLAVPVEQR